MKKLVTCVAALLLLLPLALQAQDTGTQQPKLNKKDLVIKEWNTDPKGGSKMLDHMTTYNADGRKLEEIEYNADGQKWRKRYEYDVAGGKVTTEYVYDARNRLQTVKKFEYNALGRKKVQYTYNAKGKLLSVKHFEYIAQPAD